MLEIIKKFSLLNISIKIEPGLIKANQLYITPEPFPILLSIGFFVKPIHTTTRINNLDLCILFNFLNCFDNFRLKFSKCF